MAVPLKWNTLDQAAKWLSEKTEEVWNTTKILDFAIYQCQPDDIIDDHKYPSYIRTILPEAIGDSLTGVSLLMGNSQENYVSEGIQLGGKKNRTTFVFKDNLIELMSICKSSIHYVSSDYQNEFSPFKDGEAKPVTIY